ncbi:MAG: hypothetical protein LBM25_03755 [Bacteroidales bacterium]|jgi:hypothetical protein|nr:hypothetical protein [Bacteroidales bacterium]
MFFKRFGLTLFLFLTSFVLFSQTISQREKDDILSDIKKQIKTISAFSSENLEMLPVYEFQIEGAENILNKYQEYTSINEIYAKWIELKTILEQNKEMINFLKPRIGSWFYIKAVGALSNNDSINAIDYLNKAIKYEPNNVMANYELSKISLDSGSIVRATDRLERILSRMNPTKQEELLCQNLIAFAYDKNLLQALSLINQGKFAFAVDILNELDAFCQKDIYSICNKAIVKKNLDFCKNGIYKDHIKISQKAMDIKRDDIAGDFVQNTYDYFQKNRESITDTTSFEGLVKSVVSSYMGQIRELSLTNNDEAKLDLIRKTKELASMLQGKDEDEILREIASLQGKDAFIDIKLDSIENAAPNKETFNKDYAQYNQEISNEQAQKQVKEIEKEYIVSSDNPLPEKSLLVEQTKTKTLRKEIDDKFYESRTLMSVNNYEKALEVLEKANRLARIDAEKSEVDKMYTSAIREITAKRMSKAEYCIFQGEVEKADSLVSITDDLIKTYKMEDDPTIVKIMNSYLKVIDQKVCQKKQDEVDGYVYNIIESIKNNDFYKADLLISTAMQIKGSSECRLDKQKVRQLKRQIEKPLQYVELKEEILKKLEYKDTLDFIKSYAEAEDFWTNNALSQTGVEHTPLRSILVNFGNEDLIIKSIEELVKYRLYFGSLEALGALKDLGYKRKQTKKAQKKIGMMMSLDLVKRSDKIHQSNMVDDKYKNDKWFKYFYKSYKKYLIKWRKNN